MGLSDLRSAYTAGLVPRLSGLTCGRLTEQVRRFFYIIYKGTALGFGRLLFYSESTLGFAFSSGFTRGEYHVVRGDFIAPRGGGHRDRRRDLRIPSPISPTPLNLFPGNRCGGLIGLPRFTGILDSGIRCGLFVATSTWGLGALCSALYRSRFSRSCLACIFRFSLLGEKKTLFVWLCRTFFDYR